MLKILGIAFATTITSLTSFSQTSTTKPPTNLVVSEKKSDPNVQLIEGVVVEVKDGDTFVVRSKDGSYTLRLQGIDAPETKQEFFKKSRGSLEELILNKAVKAVVHTVSNEQYISTVFVEDADVGLSQLSRGMAWYYKSLSFDQSPVNRKRYADAQTKAMSDKSGLWKDDHPIPPWVFRGDFGEASSGSPVSKENPIYIDPNPDNTKEKKYVLGPMGGCYYINESGKKVYVKDKSLCQGAVGPASKP